MMRGIIMSVVAVISCACGATPSGSTTTIETGPPRPERLYPMAEGNVWSYNIETDAGGPPILSIARVVAASGNRFEVSSNQGEPVVYEQREGGIYRVSTGTWLLRAPIEVGADWSTGSGRTARVTSVDESVETNAGDFTGCVRIEESDEMGRFIVTVYCPDVGPVLVESRLRAELTNRETFAIARLLGYVVQ